MTLRQIPMFRKTHAAPSGHALSLPSYMKVPYVCPHFETISSHICTIFGVERYIGSEGGM